LIGLGEISQFNSERLVLSPTYPSRFTVFGIGWQGLTVLRNPGGSGQFGAPTTALNPSRRGCGVPSTPATRRNPLTQPTPAFRVFPIAAGTGMLDSPFCGTVGFPPSKSGAATMRQMRLGSSIVATMLVAWASVSPGADVGVVPTDAKGVPLNLGFEDGTLKDWHAEGTAFNRMPVEGDTVSKRRGDMKSGHEGRFWVGTYERAGDPPRGTLTSVPFTLSKPFASFLIGAGSFPTTRAEIVRADNGAIIAKASGDDNEEMKRVAFDLTPHLGKEIFIRLVDDDTRGWGHVNFDDFRVHDQKPEVAKRATPDAFLYAGLSPEEAAKAMTVPEGFKVTLFAGEPDIHQPIAFAIDDKGRLWVAEAYSYPIRLLDDKAHDQILIFEDTNGDGKFDTRKVFADKLNLVSGIELGYGGVYVGAAPNLLFIPDKDGDDKPDGPPQILLDGWGYQDSHETLNTFTWGPDGWLYGCHGVFTHSRVGKPGTPDAERIPINAGIWRYHPTKHKFEVFAEGTSNPWGIAFDEHGQLFETACVIPHLYHVIQGARYERQAGPHFNPYTYEDIKTIADHRHYVGANPHGGNGRSSDAGGGHAHSGAMIYQGGAWPKEYANSIIMNNIHGARLNRDTLEPKGSGFVGHHAPDFLLANDSWSQIINMKYGPDGQVYFIDWYDRQQCHDKAMNIHDRTNGRIFKLSYGNAKPVKVDIGQLNAAELLSLHNTKNEWYTNHALRKLYEKGFFLAPAAVGFRVNLTPDAPATPHLFIQPETLEGIRNPDEFKGLARLPETDPITLLRVLWAVHACGEDKDRVNKFALLYADPHLRSWAIRLISDDGLFSKSELAKFGELAKSDPSPVVRLALASALQRMPLEDRWPILEALVDHSEDSDDHNLPLMYWYAAEPLAAADPARALKLAQGAKVPKILPFMVRRVAAIGTPEALAKLIEALDDADRSDIRRTILLGINEALKGRRNVERPAKWVGVFDELLRDADPGVRSQATALALTFGDASALPVFRGVVADPKADLALRREALAALLKAKDAELVPTLKSLLIEPAMRGQALRALASFDDPKTAEVVLKLYPSLPPAERRDALNTLAARASYAKALLAAVGEKRVAPADLSADLIRQLRNHKDSEIDASIGRVWGTARETPSDRIKLIAETKAKLLTKPTQPPDVNLGRSVYAKTCQQCHVLFGTGGNVGPELTGSNRGDLDYLLSNVIDPSALIGKDYLAHVVATKDGRVLTGIIRSEDKDAITLVTANETLTVPKPEVEARKPSEASMMPEALWAPLTDHEVRSLVAYLASPSQVPMLATNENVKAFFNGRDLTGWDGDPKLWKVENGEIVGKTNGLARNEFLRSDLSLVNFRLTAQVKLVKNEGNSGIQFRSEPLPNGEVKGYQADVGVGWWGKIYEENGRGLLWDKSGEAHVKNGEWNTYEIVAIGPKVRTFINGKPCAILDDAAGAKRGIIAFQLHSGGATEVRYKDLKVELDPTP
jgi:putative membrane-bound dehydrogenase-like protein